MRDALARALTADPATALENESHATEDEEEGSEAAAEEVLPVRDVLLVLSLQDVGDCRMDVPAYRRGMR